MPKRTKDYHAWLIQKLTDPVRAERYLKEAIKDSPKMFLKALRNVAEAKKMSKVAEEAGVNRESLYRALSEEGNPAFFTIEAVLNAVGMALIPQLKQTVTAPLPPNTTGSAQTEPISAETVSGRSQHQAFVTTGPYTEVNVAATTSTYHSVVGNGDASQSVHSNDVPWYLAAMAPQTSERQEVGQS